MKYRLLLCLAFVLVTAPMVTNAQSPTDGQIRTTADGSFEAWHSASQAWVTPVEFWKRYADGRGGLTC